MTDYSQKPAIFFGSRAIYPPWDEGSKNMVYGLARNLGDFKITLLTYKDFEPFPIPENVKLYPVFPKAQMMVVSLRQKLAFLWAVLTSEADIYHFFFSPEKTTAKILKWVKILKKGVFIQTIPTPLESLKEPSKNIFGDWVVAQSQYSKNKLVELGMQHAYCVYPGIDPKQLSLNTPTTTLKKNFGLPSKTTVVLYPGHYYLGCNDDLIHLVKKNYKKGTNVTFVFACRIAGERDIKLKSSIEKSLKKEILSGLVMLFDNVNSIYSLMSLADIVIFPPRIMTKKSEIPLALLESLALEKPIVITDLPPLNEIMKRDVGEIVPPANSEALFQAVDKLIHNPHIRRSKGKSGKQMILEEFNIRQSARNYAELYQKVLNDNFNH